MNSKSGRIVPRLLLLEPFPPQLRAVARRFAGNVARQPSPRYTFAANSPFSHLTISIRHPIVDAAVRVGRGWSKRLPPRHLESIKKRFTFHKEIGLTVQMRESPGKAQDRRQSPRMKLAEIAYIGMGPENGGLVLDVSDGGLSFHAVAPVQPAETIHFLLSLRGQSRIEGAGEVVWTNEMRTVCGLKFTSLSGGAREHLNNWTNQSRPPFADVEVTARENAAMSRRCRQQFRKRSSHPAPMRAHGNRPRSDLRNPSRRWGLFIRSQWANRCGGEQHLSLDHDWPLGRRTPVAQRICTASMWGDQKSIPWRGPQRFPDPP